MVRHRRLLPVLYCCFLFPLLSSPCMHLARAPSADHVLYSSSSILPKFLPWQDNQRPFPSSH
uniref:Uncharacterized protein n=1 Tax=Arundo donax TaxID=35708 RepID=A0A0A9B6G0_ARUDO